MLRELEPLTVRVRSEYLEMPGLRLTLTQAQRLFGLDMTVSRAVLEALVEAGFLFFHSDGCYARSAEGAPNPLPPPRAHTGRSERPSRER